MINQPVSQSLGNLPLQRLKFRIDEFDYLAAFDVDQVIVVCFGCGFIARATVAKIVTIKDAGLFEQAHCPVNRGNRDARIDRYCAGMQFFDVGMVLRFGQDLGDDTALIGNPQPAFGTKCFDVDGLVHGSGKSQNE